MGLGVGADHLVDGVDLHGLPAARVGDDWVLISRLIDQDGFGSLRKQIDNGGTSQAQCLFVHRHFQALVAAILLER